MNQDAFWSDAAVLTAIVLYSTGHWLGGSACVVLAIVKAPSR